MSVHGTLLLQMRDIGMHFGPVRVLEGVDFDVRAGEVHALAGENGAGKSTLMHLLAGVHRPVTGRIDFAGREDVRFADPGAAQKAGVATVFQERSLFSHLTVAENIFAGHPPRGRCGRIDHVTMRTEARRLLAEVGLKVRPDARVEELASDQQQMVEIAKALSLKVKLIVFDEPTAALTEHETAALFRVIRLLRARGVGVVYISHRLEEIFCLADRVTVLKDGRRQGTRDVRETTPDELVRLMIGRDLPPRERVAAKREREAEPVLEVRGFADAPDFPCERTRLRGISFQLWAGEIVGLAGLAGAGRTETALSLIGARERGAGEVLVAGRPVEIESPAAAIAAGIGYLHEDRKTAGIFAAMEIVENIAVAGLRRFGLWWQDHAAQLEFAAAKRIELKIVSRDLRQPIGELSGGNQQKCLLARWLLLRPRILVVDEPTRGVDVGAKSEVHALLRLLAGQGTAVLMISSELPEVLAVSDRILVMRQGAIVGELSGDTATEEAVMRLASLDTVS